MIGRSDIQNAALLKDMKLGGALPVITTVITYVTSSAHTHTLYDRNPAELENKRADGDILPEVVSNLQAQPDSPSPLVLLPSIPAPQIWMNPPNSSTQK